LIFNSVLASLASIRREKKEGEKRKKGKGKRKKEMGTCFGEKERTPASFSIITFPDAVPYQNTLYIPPAIWFSLGSSTGGWRKSSVGEEKKEKKKKKGKGKRKSRHEVYHQPDMSFLLIRCGRLDLPFTSSTRQQLVRGDRKRKGRKRKKKEKGGRLQGDCKESH